MPAYKDNKTDTWYCKFYYEDWTGARRQKMKRGFKLQREAKEWERTFLEYLAKNPDIPFATLVEKYRDYITPRIKISTRKIKFTIIDKHIAPYFKNKAVSEITPADISLWQNELLKSDMKESYMRAVNVQLVALFSYAVDFCGLIKNPCGKMIGKATDKSAIAFWTLDEYQKFIATVNEPISFLAFELLYYTGIRIGELMALTPADFDFKNWKLSITKTYTKIDGQELITAPKTQNSIRTIDLPEFLCTEVMNFIAMNYGMKQENRIFSTYKEYFDRQLKKYCEISGVKPIHIHGFRHSHASLLVELGANPLLVSERLGHKSVEFTLDIYSHLYPGKQSEIMRKLDALK